MWDIFNKDSLLEAAYKICRNTIIVEMAINRNDLEKDVQKKMAHAYEHYIKVLAMPEHTARNHWISEIKADFNQFHDVVYRHSNKVPTKDQWIEHTTHNSMNDYTPRGSEYVHKYLKKDYPGTKVVQIDHEETSKNFHAMMHRSFGKLSNNERVENEDVFPE